MIVAILISGLVDLDSGIKGTLERLRLRKKHACVLIKESPETLGMLRKVQQYVAYGTIDNETLKELLAKRGRLAGDKPIDPKNINDELTAKIEKGDLGKIKPFFRLQPAKGGFKKKTSRLYPHGVLGNHGKNISILLRKML